MKEMEYSEEHKIEVLDWGVYLGFTYFIMNLGTHPTAYIRIPDDVKIQTDEIECHGGITYDGDYLWVSKEDKLDGHFIGWDYTHAGDYAGYYKLPSILAINSKMWTTEEIFKEVVNVCKQLHELSRCQNADNVFYSLGWAKKEMPEEKMIEFLKFDTPYLEGESILFYEGDHTIGTHADISVKEVEAILQKTKELGWDD